MSKPFNPSNLIFPCFLSSVLAALISPALLVAQAPPGPIRATPVPSSERPAQAPQQVPEQPRVQPRTSIFGNWRLNRDESSSDRGYGGNFPNGGNGGNYPNGGNGGNYPNGGNGPYGGNRRYPGGGYPGGGYPGGGYPGGNGPYGGGPGNSGGYPDGDQQAALRPSAWMTIEERGSEIDLTDDRNQKTAVFTDGRKLQKPAKDRSYSEIAAHWDGSRLVTDEKSPRGDKMSRTFELSANGLQLVETVRVDNNRLNAPTMRYVYDTSRN